MDAIQLLMSRTSASRLEEPGPSEEQLNVMLQCAVRAPDHGRLRPWRFIVIRDGEIARFGALLAASLRHRRPDATEAMLVKAQAKAKRAPVVVVVIARVTKRTKIPAIEQFFAVGAAAQNLVLAAHALGFGTMWKTGESAYDDNVKQGLGLTTEDSIVGFIHIGSMAEDPKQTPRGQVGEALIAWGDPNSSSSKIAGA